MNFRSTSFSIGAQAIRYAGKYSASIANYQRQISSGLKLHRPSDDPVSFRQVTALSARLEELEVQKVSIHDAETKLNNSVSQLTEARSLLTSAKLLAQQAVQAFDVDERNALATEAESILRNLQDIGQTKIAGTYVYGGTRTNSPPFEFGPPASLGGTLNVKYLGASQASLAYVGDAVSIETLYPGDEVFGAIGREETILMGTTGAKVGRGTDNLIGRATLQVKHVATTFSGASGITAGASSAAKNTVLGPTGKHTVTINDTSGNGTSGTISLNGGEPVAFNNTDTDLEISAPGGQKIYVNMTNITAGFSGTIDLTATGTMSVDNGLTTVPIDFSDNSQTITDSTTGRFVHIDNRSIFKTGEDHLDFPGTSNAFQAVFELIQDLRNTRNLGATDLAAAFDRRIGDLDAASGIVLDSLGQQSASLLTLRQLGNRADDLKLQTEEQLNNVQATDIAEAVLRMKNDQSLLEYTYAITAEITSVSLIDFLR